MRLPALLAILVAAPASAAEPTTLYTHATIFTAADGEAEPLQNATLEVKAGKIVAVHKGGAKFDKPAAAVVDLAGKVIIPGLVDSHSHIGIYPKPSVPAHADGNEMSGPVQPGIRAIDAVWPADPGIKMALAGGVTTVNIMPGSGNVIGGQTIYVKLRGDTIEEMRVTGKSGDVEILGGLKMANGENPKGYGRNKQQAPYTRMKVAALQREQFLKAREYAAKRENDDKTPIDLDLEPLVEVLDRKRTVHFHSHRADDLVTAIRIAKEFDFELVLQHVTEGYRIAPLIAQRKIPCSLTLVDSPGGKMETMGLLEENAAALSKAGILVAVNTDDFITESRFYLRTAAQGMRGGLTGAEALRTVTLNPAKMLHLDHRVGSLEPGKDADFVVLSGPPLSTATKVLATYIEGKNLFDATKPGDRAYRDGGFALPPGTELPEVPKAEAILKPVSAPKSPPTTREAIKPGLFYVLAGRVRTASGEPILDGAVVVRDGKIEAVGPAKDVKRPFGAKVVTAAEVTPGLIDAGTCAGISGSYNLPADQDQDEISDPNQADLRVLDGFNPTEPMFEFLFANGITVVHAAPGRLPVLGGTTGVFAPGSTVEAGALNREFAVWVNLGETPKAAMKGKLPTTRMGTAAVVRRAFQDAKNYKVKKKDGATDPKLEALLPALEGKRPVIFAAHRADDIRTALRISDEFGLKPMIALGTEAVQLTDELAKREVPVIVHPTMQRPGDSMETLNTRLSTAAELKAKGVRVVLGTNFEGYVPKQRIVRHEAAVAAANGLGAAGALAAITLDSAKLLGIAKERGSIEVGKVADIVLYDGDPFQVTTHVTLTLQNGKIVYDRAEYQSLPLERRTLHRMGGDTGAGVGCCLGW